MVAPPDDLLPPNVARMVPYKPGKPIGELERELGIQGAIKLASNENPLGPSPKVIAAVEKAAREMAVYPDGAAYELRRAIAGHHGVGMDEVCTGNGSNELIDLICRSYPAAGDHIVFGKPSFVCYWLGSVAADRAYTEVPLRDHLAWDVNGLLDAIRPETKLLFVANPNNPTGAHLARPDLERLLSEAPPRVVIVLDEAYVEFADADDYLSALELRGLRERLLVLRTFSKAYGLAALRVGYAIGQAPAIDALHRMRAPFNVNALAQVAARVALTDPAHVQRYVELNRTERARVRHGLQELGFEVAPSQANFVLTNVAPRGLSGPGFYDRMLRRGVIVRPMPAPIESWVRITIGTPEWNDRLLSAAAEVSSEDQ